MAEPHDPAMASESTCCLLTPVGRGAVAAISVRGPAAAAAIAARFRPVSKQSPAAAAPGRILFGRWEHGGSEAEDVVVCRQGDDEWEVHCHGGRTAAEAILEQLAAAGCRIVEWPAAVLAECRDVLAAEARIALAAAPTARTAAILLDQLRGSLRAALEDLVARLHRGEARSSTEAGSAEAGLRQLIERGWLGSHLTRPWRVVLAGPPNAGKSSLVNALLGYSRAIVAGVPGTTRDVLTASTAVDGWPVELADTAGLRSTRDPLEQAAAQAARRQLASADLVVLVFDAGGSWTADDQSLRETWPAALVVHAKADLVRATSGDRPPGVATSSVTGLGLDRLLEAIAARLVLSPPVAGEAVPFTARQLAGIRHAHKALLCGDRAGAVGGLGTVLGNAVDLHAIFAISPAFPSTGIR